MFLNPRHAIQQQPAVLHSSEDFEWLNRKLDAAFLKHGKMARTVLDEVDWREVQARVLR